MATAGRPGTWSKGPRQWVGLPEFRGAEQGEVLTQFCWLGVQGGCCPISKSQQEGPSTVQTPWALAHFDFGMEFRNFCTQMQKTYVPP